jgi:release factor glutamine methyltransferase
MSTDCIFETMQLSLLKALYIDTLSSLYSYKEAEGIFYIVALHLDGKSKIDVLLGAETYLGESYQFFLAELNKGVPVQYLTNRAPFYNLELYVDHNVLIPRPETEQLVHLILNEQRGTVKSVLDIGTGSGCIALALKNEWHEATISACDSSLEALNVAEKNAKKLNLEVKFFYCDILKEPIDLYDIIVANPPYILPTESKKMHKNVLDFEPHSALFVTDEDPLQFYKQIIQLASIQKSTCYFETSEFYRKQLDEWLQNENILGEWKQDFQGKDRILKITW